MSDSIKTFIGISYLLSFFFLLLLFPVACSQRQDLPKVPESPKIRGDKENPYSRTKSSTPSYYKQSWAVIVGINTYKNPGTPALNYAVKDAKDIAAALERMGFPRQNIFLLVNQEATKQAIEEALYERLSRVGQDDRVLVFFAGHGVEQSLPHHKGSEGFLLPYDVDRSSPNTLYRTAISMKYIQDGLNIAKLS